MQEAEPAVPLRPAPESQRVLRLLGGRHGQAAGKRREGGLVSGSTGVEDGGKLRTKKLSLGGYDTVTRYRTVKHSKLIRHCPDQLEA